MKKNLLYLLLVIVLGALTYYFVFRDDNASFDQHEANFTVKDTAAITQIFLTDLKQNKIKIERKNNEWVLNDKYSPTPDLLNLLLKALHDQIPEQPVAISYHDEVIKNLAGNNVKVEIYKNNKQSNVFYVAKDPSPNNLTYMLTEGAKRPFIVKLPFENAFVGIRYMTDVDSWRNRNLFTHTTPIEYIEVRYKDSIQFNYKLTMNDTMPTITGKSTYTEPLNMRRVNSYLKFADNIFCVAYDNSNFEKETILREGKEMATVKFKRKNNQEDELIIYFRPADQGTKGIITLDGKEYDNDYFYGYLNKQDFISIGIESVEKLFRKHQEFFEKD